MSKTIRLSLGKISGAPQVNQQSVSQAGMVGRELAQIGKTIAQTGEKVGTIVERRRAEEARAEAAAARARNDIASKQELAEAKEAFKDNPLGMSKELDKIQAKRHKLTLKGMKSERAKTLMTEEFELSRLENQLTANTHEREEFTKSSVRQEDQAAKDKAQSDFIYPPAAQEFKLDLATDLEFVKQRDWDEDTKTKVSQSIVKTRTKGVIDGYMSGGNMRDFSRAEGLVQDLVTNGLLSSPDAVTYQRNIDNERRRKMNDDIFRERQEITAATKAFDNEKWALKSEYEKVAQDPNYDPTASLRGYKKRGLISTSNYKIVSETKMGIVQKEVSDNTKYSLMEEMSSSSDVRQIRNLVNNAALEGSLSAEAAQEVMNSAEIRLSSKMASKAYSESDAMLKQHATSGNLFDKKTDIATLHRMKVTRDQIVASTGISPYEAGLMTLREFKGKVSVKRVSGLSADTSTLKGAQEGLEEIVKKKEDGEIDAKRAATLYKRLQNIIQTHQSKDSGTVKEFLKDREAR